MKRPPGRPKKNLGASCNACARRAQQLTDEQVGQLVQQTRSRTKAARTQAAPSACASTSKAPSSSSSSSSSEVSKESASSRDGGLKKQIFGEGQQRRRALEQRASS